MAGNKLTIAITGTFDVLNYGDLLFPLLMEQELRQRVGDIDVLRFSYRSKAPPAWPYSVHSVGELPSYVPNINALVVGGGHLVRFDKTIAPGYGPCSHMIHHPTGYWLIPALLIANAGKPVIWNGVGVSPDTPSWAQPMLSAALHASEYVSIRDQNSLHELVRIAPSVDFRLTPDSAFGVASLVKREKPSLAFTQWQEASGLKKYVLLQASPFLKTCCRQIEDALRALQREGYRIVEVPIGPVLGDALGVLDIDVPDIIPFDDWLDPILVTDLIAHSSAVVAQSLHLSISALSFGIPVFRMPPPKPSKYEILESFHNVHFFTEDEHSLAAKILEKVDRVEVYDDVVEQSAQLRIHWNAIAELVTRSSLSDRPEKFRSIGDFFFQLPKHLERTCDLEKIVDEKQQQVIDLSTERERLVQESARLEGEIQRKDAQAAGVSAELDRMVDEVRQQRQAMVQKDREIYELSHSESYRVGLLCTWPFRKAWKLSRYFLHEMTDWKCSLQAIPDHWQRGAYTSINLRSMRLPVERIEPRTVMSAVRWTVQELGGSGKTALNLPLGARISYRLLVPARAFFQVYIGVNPSNRIRPKFVVTAKAVADDELTFTHWLRKTKVCTNSQWLKFRLNLAALANQEAEIELFTVANENAASDVEVTFWGEPKILVRNSPWAIGKKLLGKIRTRGFRLATTRPVSPQNKGEHTKGSPAFPQENFCSRYERMCRQYSKLKRVDRDAILRLVESLSNQPLITVVIVSDGIAGYVSVGAVEAVRKQIYRNWELFVAYGCAEPEFNSMLNNWSQTDSRVKRLRIPTGYKKEEIYKEVLTQCHGDYVLFLSNPSKQILFEWLLAAFVLLSVNERDSSIFPVQLGTDLYQFLISEQFPINEVRLARCLRAIPVSQSDQVGHNGVICESTHSPENVDPEPVLENTNIRAIAFYLPQFHQIPENDKWWGTGFTEWTHVRRARPFFIGHDQPRVPADLGYYDLTSADVRRKQAELAKSYGIYGFCYYHYRFGKKRLLERPFKEVLESGEPDFPFCLCWANENWTRRWDGLDQKILIAQNYSPENDRTFIEELLPAFGDRRYIKINGRPLLIVYRPGDLPEPQSTFDTWRQIVKAHGFPELYLAGVHSFGWFEDPREHGMDAAIEFPVHFWVQKADGRESWPVEQLDPNFVGQISPYYLFKECSTSRPRPSYTLFKGVMPVWDNTARRMERASIIHTCNLVPEVYYAWLRRLVDYTRKTFAGEERLVFINAWNEWGEGCYLEPDKTHGHSLLRATRLALSGAESPLEAASISSQVDNTRDVLQVVFVSHDAFRAGAQRLLLTLIQWLSESAGVRAKVILRRGGVLEGEFARIAPVLQLDCVPDDRIPTLVQNFIGNDASLIYINTLVPGDIARIAAELGIPIITHVHELQNAIERWCSKELLEAILETTNHFITVSGPVLHNLINRHNVDPRQITVIEAFINASSPIIRSAGKVELRRRKQLPDREFIVFGCGTTDWRKGPDLFIDVAQVTRDLGAEDVHFYWIGKDTFEERQLLQGRIQSYGLENCVTFLGEVSEPWNYFKTGDVFLLTSREDPFPLVCLEAAACGLPILCFEGSGGMPEFVKDDIGFIVPFGDVKAMAEKLVWLRHNAAERTRLGGQAREKVRSKHDVSLAGQRVFELIRRFARDNQGSNGRGNSKQLLRPAPSRIPKVSVIVPNYNHAPFLGQRLDSIMTQEFQDFEIIVLDDASTDKSREVLESYIGNPKIQFLFNEVCSGSASKQWKKGLGAARGEYVWFAESDDYASADFLGTLVSALDRNPAVGLACCQSYLINREGKILGDGTSWTSDLDAVRWTRDFINNGRAEIRDYLCKKNTIPNASAVLLRAKSLRSVGELDMSLKLCGDWLVWIKVLLRSDIAYIAQRMNYWRQDSSNSRPYPPGVLEWKEGEEILRYVSQELGLSEVETDKILFDFLKRCWRWRNFSLNESPEDAVPKQLSSTAERSRY